MPDVFTPEERSELMARVRGKDTQPERIVRSMVHRMGYRFKLHDGRLPGRPDMVLPRHRKVIFVHGCFWHGHEGCSRSKPPSSNVDFWKKKLGANKERDIRILEELEMDGWKTLVIWECETRKREELQERLAAFLKGGDG